MCDVSLSFLLGLILLQNNSCEVKYGEYFTSLRFPKLKNSSKKKDEGVWHPLRTKMSDLDFEYGNRPRLKKYNEIQFRPSMKTPLTLCYKYQKAEYVQWKSLPLLWQYHETHKYTVSKKWLVYQSQSRVTDTRTIVFILWYRIKNSARSFAACGMQRLALSL